MRTGIVDLGTNSLKFSFWDISPQSKRAELLYRKKTMILPGEDVFRTGKIPPKSLKRILKALRLYEAKAAFLHTEGTVAFATCALREATNSKAILKTIQAQTSVPLKVISGPREAELIARGILRSEPQLRGPRILIDIGGGSTEISLVIDRKVLRSVSLPLGAQRLYQMFPQLMEGSPTEVRLEIAEQVRAHINKQLNKNLKDWPRNKAQIALGSSGTIRTLGRLITRRRAAGRSRLAWIRQMSAPSKTLPKYQTVELKKLNQSLMFLTDKQLEMLAGVEPERRPLLVHGAILLEEILNYFSLTKVSCTDGSLRDGVILEIMEGLLRPQAIAKAKGRSKVQRKKKITKLKSKKIKKLRRILQKISKTTRKKV